MNSDLQFLGVLEDVIVERLGSDDAESYTASLVASGPQRIAQKVGEEGVELALASASGSTGDVLNEAADLVYHVMVLLHSHGLSLGDVARTLETRHRN